MLSKRPSLKRSLTLTLIGCLSALWCTAIYLTLRDARHEVDELFDAQLAQLARGTLAQIVSGQATYSFAQNMHDSEHREPGHLYEQKINFQISRKSEVLSKSTKDLLLPPDIKPGFSNIEIGQQEWRLFHLADKINEVEVTTLQSVDIRNELAHNIAQNLVNPSLFMLVLLSITIWTLVGLGLKPVSKLAEQISSRASSDFTPVVTTDTPQEVLPLLLSLNQLFERIAAMMDGERRFTADAAHELRTPLAAIKAQAQVAANTKNEGERQHALKEVSTAVDRAGRLVSQLLTLARLDPELPLATKSKVDLRQIITQVAADEGSFAVDKNIDFEFDARIALLVPGDSDLLAIMFRNLINNAIRYTPSSGTIRMSLEETSDHAVFLIDDSGPGLTDEEKSIVFDRFKRILRIGESGSGLGLSIAKKIADLHRGQIILEDTPSKLGLRVRTVLPKTSL